METRDFREFLNARYRCCYLLFKVLIGLGFLAVTWKAFSLQVLEYEVWQERGRAQSETTFQVPSYRGSIHDRQGRLMAYSVPQHSLFADGEQIQNPPELAAQLASVLDEPQSSIQKKLKRDRRFIWIGRQLSDHQADIVKNMKAKGLQLVDEYKRFYPYRQVAGQVLGFVGIDGVGLEGIEKTYDSLLRQEPLTLGQFRDGTRKPLWLSESLPDEPKERQGIRLSIDAYIQYICEQELEKAVRQHRARFGEVVVLNPYTFEVLAMANWPPFDPNLYKGESPDSWRNRAVTDCFEPGSTFKVFVVAAALEEGIVRKNDRIFCENGRYRFARHTINDTHGHGWVTVPQVVKYSSNIGAAKIALKMGAKRFYRYLCSFGFGSMTGINFPGESKGLLRPWQKWYPIDLAVTGFGQSVGVTSLQLTAAVACIGNGGQYAQPVLAKEIVDAQGEVIKTFDPHPLERVIREETASAVRDMMVGVTQKGGTGTKAAMKQYTVAGKTGTAQTLDPQTKRYSSNKYNAVFTGFVPAERPSLAITVLIGEPQGETYGGIVSAPVFKEIAEQVLPYLGVAPSHEVKDPPLKLTWIKNASQSFQESLKVEATDQKSVLVPDVKGLSLKVALQRLSTLGFQPQFQGSGKVVKQNPQPGKSLQRGATVALTLEE